MLVLPWLSSVSGRSLGNDVCVCGAWTTELSFQPQGGLATGEDPEQAQCPCTHHRSSHKRREQARVREERERAVTRACEQVWLEETSWFTQKVTTAIGARLCGFPAGPAWQVCAGLCTQSEQLWTVGASLAGGLNLYPNTLLPRIHSFQAGRPWQRAAWVVPPARLKVTQRPPHGLQEASRGGHWAQPHGGHVRWLLIRAGPTCSLPVVSSTLQWASPNPGDSLPHDLYCLLHETPPHLSRT